MPQKKEEESIADASKIIALNRAKAEQSDEERRKRKKREKEWYRKRGVDVDKMTYFKGI